MPGTPFRASQSTDGRQPLGDAHAEGSPGGPTDSEQGSRDCFLAVATRIPARKRRAVIAALADLNAAVAGTAGGDHP